MTTFSTDLSIYLLCSVPFSPPPPKRVFCLQVFFRLFCSINFLVREGFRARHHHHHYTTTPRQVYPHHVETYRSIHRQTFLFPLPASFLLLLLEINFLLFRSLLFLASRCSTWSYLILRYVLVRSILGTTLSTNLKCHA